MCSVGVYELLNDLLCRIGDDFDFEVESDGNTLIFTYADLYDCWITADEANDLFEVRTQLCLVDDARRDQIYGEALRLNLNFDHTQGATIALSNNVLLLRAEHTARSLDRERLTDALARLIAAAGRIRERLLGADADMMTDGANVFAHQTEHLVILRP